MFFKTYINNKKHINICRVQCSFCFGEHTCPELVHENMFHMGCYMLFLTAGQPVLAQARPGLVLAWPAPAKVLPGLWPGLVLARPGPARAGQQISDLADLGNIFPERFFLGDGLPYFPRSQH